MTKTRGPESSFHRCLLNISAHVGDLSSEGLCKHWRDHSYLVSSTHDTLHVLSQSYTARI